MVLYRVESTSWADGSLSINYREFEVIRETNFYFIIKHPYELEAIKNRKTKRVSKEAKSAFARPTKEAALHDFACRKKRYISILKARLKKAKEFLFMAENNKTEGRIPFFDSSYMYD